MASSGTRWESLSIAGKFDLAKAAFERALELRDKPYSPVEEPRLVVDYDRYAGFFAAMNQWQLADKAAARETFDGAVAWMNEHAPGDTQLKQFRAEAQQLLGAGADKPSDAVVDKNAQP